jgi:hypothetical protein
MIDGAARAAARGDVGPRPSSDGDGITPARAPAGKEARPVRYTLHPAALLEQARDVRATERSRRSSVSPARR